MAPGIRSPTSLRIFAPPILDFLYPAFTHFGRKVPRTCHFLQKRRHIETQSISSSLPQELASSLPLLSLPISCPGCGAYTQNVTSDGPGFYDPHRKSVRAYLSRTKPHKSKNEAAHEDDIVRRALEAAEEPIRKQLAISQPTETMRASADEVDMKGGPLSQNLENAVPVCDRCHRLLHHNNAEPATNLTVQSVRKIIQDSPHKHNHIYHVLDAADFPLSLIPTLQKNLSLSPQRSKNRRAPTTHYYGGRRADVSFIITRADLLAPTKEKLERLMPYLVQVLRESIGGSGQHIRLGNVRCVSAHRGWWTKVVKEDIWTRGGGGWMVGKANVGKSSLLENIFPKGRMENRLSAVSQLAGSNMRHSQVGGPPSTSGFEGNKTGAPSLSKLEERYLHLFGSSMLPPAPPEQMFPTLPTVSALPGTTAAPIRNVFGNGRGELIDLPGLTRGDLHSFVDPQHRKTLVMRSRIVPEQLTIKPGQAIILGGLVTIIPIDPDVTILAYPFLPLPAHVTSIEKARAMVEQQIFPQGTSFVRPGVGHRMLHAGTFPLKWDVTKERAGPLTRRDAVGLKPEVLHFIVFSTDILVEGCGWIELVCQVRKRRLETENASHGLFDATPYPMVEVISPDGSHIGVRRPMGAWLVGKKPTPAKVTIRPRRSMKGVKKRMKELARAKLKAS